jgi:hypothetical protein
MFFMVSDILRRTASGRRLPPFCLTQIDDAKVRKIIETAKHFLNFFHRKVHKKDVPFPWTFARSKADVCPAQTLGLTAAKPVHSEGAAAARFDR